MAQNRQGQFLDINPQRPQDPLSPILKDHEELYEAICEFQNNDIVFFCDPMSYPLLLPDRHPTCPGQLIPRQQIKKLAALLPSGYVCLCMGSNDTVSRQSG